jgi:hypothetical protein
MDASFQSFLQGLKAPWSHGARPRPFVPQGKLKPGPPEEKSKATAENKIERNDKRKILRTTSVGYFNRGLG